MGITNTEIMAELGVLRADVGKMTTSVAVHISQCERMWDDTNRNSVAIFGNGKKGMYHKIEELVDAINKKTKAEVTQEKFKLDIKSSVVVIILTLGAQFIAKILGILP